MTPSPVLGPIATYYGNPVVVVKPSGFRDPVEPARHTYYYCQLIPAPSLLKPPNGVSEPLPCERSHASLRYLPLTDNEKDSIRRAPERKARDAQDSGDRSLADRIC